VTVKSYDMGQQIEQGESAERYLDFYFGAEFAIRPATREQQRLGIDRIFTRRTDGREWLIQYKADKTAARTGNAFVETVSVDTAGKEGWALTCTADFIMYYVVGIGPLYILRPNDIRAKIQEWQRQYPERRIPNGTYHSVGLLVPLDEFERAAVQVVSI
jgi:hypothetical protein